MPVLILGGTTEARELAAALRGRAITSLAGRVRNPALPVGETLIGGFGGPAGLAAYLSSHPISHLVDATHPFATTITANAARAAADTGVPLLVLRRPAWTAGPGDRWTHVRTVAAAAAAAARITPPGSTVFVTTGRRELAPFTADRHYLIRAVDPPDWTPPTATILLDRGPFTVCNERNLMLHHQVRAVVTRNSGGTATQAKLTAARDLHLPVILVDRPPLPTPTPQVAETVPEVLTWLGSTR